MTDVRPGGNRRIDRVLAEDFLDGLPRLPLPDLRVRRAEAEQEEVDLSYLRRLLQGRIDICRSELERRRSGAPAGSVVHELTIVLSDQPAPPHGLGRHSRVGPSRVDQHRRRVEALVADVELADVTARTDEELERALATFEGEERTVSRLRRAVQQVMDRCSAEIARRYREGEADVAALLTGDQR